MGAIIARQPNGLLCRWSTIVDHITHYDMTEEEYIEICAERAREEAKERIKNNLDSFSNIERNFEIYLYNNPELSKEAHLIMDSMNKVAE